MKLTSKVVKEGTIYEKDYVVEYEILEVRNTEINVSVYIATVWLYGEVYESAYFTDLNEAKQFVKKVIAEILGDEQK